MATIFCFTSTGNSLYTAKKIADKIGGNVLPMNRGPIKCDDDIIGFVFPVYFWGLPRMVERFALSLQITNKEAYVFSVMTCGSRMVGVFGLLNKLLISKNNISLQYGARIIAVENYIPMYKINDSESFRNKVDERIIDVAKAISDRKVNRISMLTFLNKFIYKLLPDESSDQYFTVAPMCTGCGICAKICPAKNISMETGKPLFQHKCEHCLACLHHCPVRAIDWKEKTSGKERFRNNGVSLDELIAFYK